MTFEKLDEKYCAVYMVPNGKIVDDVTIFRKNKDDKYWENSKYFTTDIKHGILLSLDSKCFFSAYNVEEEEGRKLIKKYYDEHIQDKKYYALDFGLYDEK